MADQAAACHALEQATLHLQSPNAHVRSEAEKQLLQLKRLPVSELFSLVQVVMGKTVDVGARFHGVQTLRSACLDQWTGTNRQVFGSVRDWAVSSALQCRDEVVRSQLLCACEVTEGILVESAAPWTGAEVGETGGELYYYYYYNNNYYYYYNNYYYY